MTRHIAGCGQPRGKGVCLCWCHERSDARRVIYALARETLAMRDGYDKRGWVMNEMPYEAEVRAALDAELRESLL